MAHQGTVNWPIGPNQTLAFEAHDANGPWNSVPGLYIFARPSGANWSAVYVGQADDLSTRLPNHNRLDEAVRAGATQIHAMVEHLQAERDRLERLLIQHLQPPLNAQHRGGILG